MDCRSRAPPRDNDAVVLGAIDYSITPNGKAADIRTEVIADFSEERRPDMLLANFFDPVEKPQRDVSTQRALSRRAGPDRRGPALPVRPVQESAATQALYGIGALLCRSVAASRRRGPRRCFWQATRHAEVIETEPFSRQKFDYLHDNPRRKGLVLRSEHWRFSSAGYYASDGREQGDVPIIGFAW